MASGTARGRTPTPTGHKLKSAKPTPSPSLGPATMEPPPKKPRLKLNVREPSQSSQSQSPDTIAVSRPKRESSLRIRYSEDMNINDDDADSVSSFQLQIPRPSPAATSDISSLSSLHPTEKEPTPANEDIEAPAKPPRRDYGRDFMSYYVAGGDEDEGEEAPKPASSEQELPKKPAPAEPAKQPPAVQALPPQPPRDTQFKHHQVPPTYPIQKPPPSPPPPPRPPPPQPTVHLIDTIKKAPPSKEPDTVAAMVRKLEALSTALTNFGGVPGAPKSPIEVKDDTPEPASKSKPEAKPAAEKETDVDDFLAMFDDEDGDEKKVEKGDSKPTGSYLHRALDNPGAPDGPLTYGIQFIQNALKSWAQQRLSSQYAQHYHEVHQQAQNEAQAKRGPGRPRKFDEDVGPRRASLPPAIIQMDLAKTPEGAAIAAFQQVIDAGCLQVNAVLPKELTRALRHLYMQIDQLINQGSRNEPEWQCMSYGAQIAAQKVRVDSWKDARAKASEEMARQQQLSHQQVMQQMGIPQPRAPMSTEQAQHAHAVELERKRSLQLAAQQPHLSRYLTNALTLQSQSAPSPTGGAPSQSPVNGTSAGTPTGSTAQTNPHNGMPSSSIAADLRAAKLNELKSQTPSLLSRSGQSMKFSFAPTNDLAVKAFGRDAFPVPSTGSSIPNRGPMSAGPSMPPLATNGSFRQMDGSRPSSATGLKGSISWDRQPSDTIEVAIKNGNGERRRSQASPTDAHSTFIAMTGKPGSKGTPIPTSGSTAVNKSSPGPVVNSWKAMAPPTKRLSIDIPNGNGSPIVGPASASPRTAVSATTPMDVDNADEARGTDLASRFPHPGAVIVDE
ncbi:hypothetical protein LTR37_007378 [Vermiconidia calcicola]|uniref:Uncharacterized protein n=1 Tax=Vermiconidia calcicola TaxID=1690605 RepID=A0ACC3NEE6_9PEZI|nr:hypothetical protein LTR37_007378 [Vermiconidia calcicola]